MHPSLSLLVVACVLAGCSPERTPVTEQPAAAGEPGAAPAPSTPEARALTRLTVYSGDYESLARIERSSDQMPGYALVQRPLQYTLKKGRSVVSATNLPPAMDVEAAMVRPQSAGVEIVSQRYIAPLSGSADVASQMLGQRVAVEHTAGGAKQTDSGTLLAADEGLTLALSDGRIKVIREYDSFSVIDGVNRIPQEAALQWTVAAQEAGDASFLLSYPMAGMAWRAEYLATLEKGEDCRLALDGAALVANRSGVTFSQAQLTLVAGEPNRETRDGGSPRVMMAQESQDAAAAPAMPTRRTSGEYHAYEIPGTTRIDTGTTERVALFARRPAVACERGYVVDAGAPQWQPPQPMLDPGFRGETGRLPVTAAVSLQNTKAAGLGQPLPAGRVRVFDGDDFLGESRLQHTPAGADIRLEVGKAFDLTAERENTGFRVDRSGRTITESFAITLANAGQADTTIRVVEPLPRWSDWEIVSSSVPVSEKSAQQVEFEVPVAAGDETVLTYTVRYQWAPGVIR